MAKCPVKSCKEYDTEVFENCSGYGIQWDGNTCSEYYKYFKKLERNKLRKIQRETIDKSSFPHEIKKKCKDCGEIKFCKWNSTFSSKGIPQYKSRCIDCHNKWLREKRRTQHSKQIRNKWRKKSLRLKKKKAINLLGGKCMLCGYNKCLSALTFHHKNPSEKEFEIGLIKDYSWKKVKKELDKCDLLCFNCHMELHEKLNKYSEERNV